MKKIKFLLSILLIFLFFKCENVYASQELTCIYEHSGVSDYMFIQDSAGKLNLYYQDYNESLPASLDDWKLMEDVEFYFNKTTKYSDGNLTSCPQYATFKSGYKFIWFGSFQKKFTFYDNDGKGNLVEERKDIISKPLTTEEEIQNTQWLGTCDYENVTLYFNYDKMLLNNKSVYTASVTAGFSLEELLEYIELNKFDGKSVCPALYRKASQPVVGAGDVFNYATYFLYKERSTYEDTFISGSIDLQYDNEKESIVIVDCLDLFSDNFISNLNSILFIIRIAIPILLIVLGILDFVKAIFAGKEDEMKKAQSNFIRRVIAAIVVFLIPTLVNFLLEIANGIWNNIDPNSCKIG